jgi:hypothetical protein
MGGAVFEPQPGTSRYPPLVFSRGFDIIVKSPGIGE